MSNHTAVVSWERNDAKFVDNKYSRVHKWSFDGGSVIPASSSPHVVRIPFSDPTCVDPEEAFVASLSSCHMLWFLGFAARDGYVVESYTDEVVGIMEKNLDGKEAITVVNLRPMVVLAGGKEATDEILKNLHHEAHENCFLATSVKTDIRIDSKWRFA